MVSVGPGYDVFSVAMNTSTGNQALVGSCGGRTPKAAILIATRSTTLGTIVAGAMLSAGLTDGTNHRLLSAMSEDGTAVAVHDTGRRQSDAALVQVLTTGDETLDGEASFVSFSADTITINITDAPSTAVQLIVWLFFGDGLQAVAGTTTTSTSIGGTVTVTGLPFTPRALIALGSALAFTPASGQNMRFGIGAAAFNGVGGAIQQFCQVINERDTPTTLTGCSQGVRDDCLVARISTTATGGLNDESRADVTAVTADGFTLTTRDVATFTITVGFLALYTGNSRAWAGMPSLPTTSTGTKSVTGPGWKPQCVLALGSMFPAASKNTYQVNTQAIHMSLGISVGAAGLCSVFQSLDGNAVSNTRSLTDQKLVAAVNDSGTLDWDATLSAFTATGFDVSIGTASGVDRLVGFLAFEASTTVLSDAEQTADQTALSVGLAPSDTEQTSDQTALNVGVARSDTEQITDQVIAFLNTSLPVSDFEQLTDFAVLISSATTNTDLIASDAEQLTDQAVLLWALVVSDVEQLLENVGVSGAARIVLSDAEQLTETDLVFLGRLLVSSEMEEITDLVATPLRVTAEKASMRGTTYQGGAVAGWTYQAGAERGETLDG